MTTTNHHVTFDRYGDADVLHFRESAIPECGPGQVLLRVGAIGVNYSDILRRRDRYFMPTPLPYVPGTEVVGEIVASGEGVAAPLTEGARVLAILPSGGGYAEYVTAAAPYCVPLPPEIDDRTATAIFVQGSTAQLMIAQLAGELEGKTVLINAAAGGVGSLLVQLAKLGGARVIGAAGGAEKGKIVRELGADAAVDYRAAGWSERVREANGGRGVDVVFEMVGGEVYNESLRALAPGGHLIVYGCASGVQGTVDPEYFVDHNLRQSGFNLAHYLQHHNPVWQRALGDVMGVLASGRLRVRAAQTYPLERAAEAHRQLEARETTGKVVLLTRV